MPATSELSAAYVGTRPVTAMYRGTRPIAFSSGGLPGPIVLGTAVATQTGALSQLASHPAGSGVIVAAYGKRDFGTWLSISSAVGGMDNPVLLHESHAGNEAFVIWYGTSTESAVSVGITFWSGPDQTGGQGTATPQVKVGIAYDVPVTPTLLSGPPRTFGTAAFSAPGWSLAGTQITPPAVTEVSDLSSHAYLNIIGVGDSGTTTGPEGWYDDIAAANTTSGSDAGLFIASQASGGDLPTTAQSILQNTDFAVGYGIMLAQILVAAAPVD